MSNTLEEDENAALDGEGVMAVPIEVAKALSKATVETNWISLIGAKLSRSPPQLTSGHFMFLTQLYLGHNQLTTLPDALFSSNMCLRGLFLQNNFLVELSPEINRCQELQELYLSCNSLSHLPSMRDLTQLDCLWLEDNPLLPFHLQQNISRNKAKTQLLVADIGLRYHPRLEHCQRALITLLCVSTFAPAFQLPPELQERLQQMIWRGRFDPEWDIKAVAGSNESI
jgi:hypothetical protein